MTLSRSATLKSASQYNKQYYDEHKDDINNNARIDYKYNEDNRNKRLNYYKQFEKNINCEICNVNIKNEKYIRFHNMSYKHLNNVKIKELLENNNKNLNLVIQDNINKDKTLDKLKLELEKKSIKPLELSELRKRRF